MISEFQSLSPNLQIHVGMFLVVEQSNLPATMQEGQAPSKIS